jgi:hypothetical protein
MEPWHVILILAGVGLLIFIGIKAAQAHAERERQRLAGLHGWAAANGFLLYRDDPWNLDSRYNGVADIGRGHDRYAFEVLGRYEPVTATIFRYHFKTWETRTVTHNGRTRTERYEQRHWRRYLIAELGGHFPHFFLRAEGLFDRIAGFIGFDDIDFESEEFSKRYFCKSDDRQFAYAVVHPQMMEWMLSRRFEGELRQGLLVMDVSASAHSAQGCHEAWSNAAGFVNRIPPFVWQDYGRRPPIQLPDPVPYTAPTAAPAGRANAGVQPVP